MGEVSSIGHPYDGSPVDLSFYALSTVIIQKLTINYFLFPNSKLLALIFPLLTHLKINLYLDLLSVQNVCVRFPFILFDNWIRVS